MPTLSSAASLSPATAAEVRALAGAIEARDGQPPLSDRALTRLTSTDVDHVLATDDDGTVHAYAQIDGSGAEVVAERAGFLRALVTRFPRITEIWSHGTRSALAPTLAETDFEPVRILHQLRRPGSLPVPDVVLPDGVSVTTFRPGVDEADWLRVNAAAFAHHPEQGGVTLADLQALEAEAWFDPAGFFLARDGDALLGFHWTKVHADGNGEVYVVGIDPSAQGRGLGRVLLDVGLAHLAGRGCPEVLLYVDDSNTAAMRLYESTGFVRFDADTQWVRSDRGGVEDVADAADGAQVP